MTDSNREREPHRAANEPQRTGPLGTIEGTDAGALGIDPPPGAAPSAAEVDPSEEHVPGPAFDDVPRTESKPWFTSLAAESEQAGVANDDPDEQPPQFPTDPETGRKP
jgi:hypothetical protein